MFIRDRGVDLRSTPVWASSRWDEVETSPLPAIRPASGLERANVPTDPDMRTQSRRGPGQGPWGGLLAGTLGLALVLALVAAGMSAPHRARERAGGSIREASVSTGSAGGSSMDFDTSGSSGSDSFGTAGDTGGSSFDSGTSSSAAADTSGSGGATGSSGGGGAGAAGGAKTLRPPAGRYAVTGSGVEKTIGAPGAPEAWRQMAYEVRHRSDGCHEIDVTYHPHHRGTDRYCPTKDGGLIVPTNVTFSEVELVKGWDTIKVNTTTTCDPPEIMVRGSMQPGQSWSDVCYGESDNKKQAPGRNKLENTMTFVGIEEVAGVQAYRIHQDQKLTPATSDNTQNGTMSSDTWFSTENGLVLKVTRKSRVDTDSIIGKVTYTEEGEFTLTSPKPQ
ncbi:MAG: hypothetical protein DYH08_11270 [Actinobacteria bacterium ATB1]|nr:hypothetical protein [Actinobacteria bacterium ATB1]